MIKTIFQNLIGFDALIFIAAFINAYVFWLARNSANELYSKMHRTVYTPTYIKDIDNITDDIENLTENTVSAIREKAIGLYTLYVNISAIFPLLGILGTVVSLIGMVDNMGNISTGFFAALTSTFWGIIFSIIFKIADGAISTKLDDAEKAAELFMRKPEYQKPEYKAPSESDADSV